MSMSFGGGAATDPATMRGRAWPTLRQFCVFLENRVGRMHDLLRHLESDDLRVMALSIVDSVDFAVARLVLSNYERARELFDLSEFMVVETDVVGVQLPDESQPYVSICTALLQAEVNIHYTYPLLYRRQGRGAIVLCVDDIDQALKTLEEKRHRIVAENDLLEDDEFL
ncbi:MAG: acetolactate synthase [Planctomycetaceae bacterium]